MSEATSPAQPEPPKSQGQEVRAENAWRVILLAALALVLLQVLTHPWDINHDAALYVHCGQLLLAGMRPYVDFIDLNPPLIMYLNVIPALVAKLTAANPILCYQLFVFALLVASISGTRFVLRRARPELSESALGLSILMWIGFSAFLFRPKEMDWGQREHLFVLLYAPSFFLRHLRWNGGKAGPLGAVMIGTTAAVGACLKPHFVLIALSVEGYQLLKSRKFAPLISPEFLAFATTGLLYAVHFIFLPREVREAFFGRWLPFVGENYATYNESWSGVLNQPYFYTALPVGLLALVYRPPRENFGTGLLRPLGVFTVASSVVYLAQHKGWSYQAVTAQAGMWAIAFVYLVEAIGPKIEKSGSLSGLYSKRTLGLGIVGASAIALLQFGIRAREEFAPSNDNAMRGIVEYETAPGDPLLFISTTVAIAYPTLLQVDRTLGSRYLWTFPMAMLYGSEPDTPEGEFPYRTGEAVGEEERRFLAELGEDIAHYRPRIVIVDHDGQAQGCPAGFSPAEYLDVVGFVDQHMSDYEARPKIMGRKIYVLRAGGA